jgi:HK97 family phage major capsid protein
MASVLVEKRERLGTLQKLVGRVLDEAGTDQDWSKVTCLGPDMDTQAKLDKLRELNLEMTDLSAECVKLEVEEIGKARQAVQERMDKPINPITQPSSGGVKTLGERFTESDEFADAQSGGFKAAGVAMSFEDVELKTLMQTVEGWAPATDQTGRVVEAVTRPVQVLDLIPVGSTDSGSVSYMEEVLRTHSAAEKGEGVTYAESVFKYEEVTVAVRKITDSLPITDEQLEDVPQLRSIIDQRLRFGLRQRLDTQVISGTDVPPNIQGILNKSGIQTQAKGTDPRFDAIHKALTLVRVTGRAEPSAIVIHPNDWEAIRLTRTADGIYILGNPAVAGPMTLWGVPVVVGDVMTENTVLVGAFSQHCMIFDRRGVDIQLGFSGTQFVEGKATLRADLRAAFAIFRAAAFCTVTGM